MSKKFTIAGSLAVTEDLSVKNLTVTGKTTTENQETLSVKDNLIITNAEGVDLQSLLSGLAIRKDSLSAYGIVYDPSDDSVKLGLGSIVEGEFKFDENEGLPVVVRGDLVDGNLVQFSSTGNKLVDSGKGISELVTFTDYATNSTPGTIIVGGISRGLYIGPNGILTTYSAGPTDIDEKTNVYKPITPKVLNYAVKVGVTTNTETLSDTEKTDACKWLGAIPNAIPSQRNYSDGKLLGFNSADALTYTQIITGASGDEKLLQYTIPIRGETGVIYGATPTTDWGLTPKKYVDEAIASAAGTKVLVGGEAVAEFDADTKVGFTDYAISKADKNGAFKAGVVRMNENNAGMQVTPDGYLQLAIATPVGLTLRNQTGIVASNRAPIAMGNLNIAVIAALTDDKRIIMTDEEKSVACETLGAVKAQNPTFDEGATRGYVYFINTSKEQVVKPVQIQSNADTIPLRNPNGNFYVGTPTLDYECVNKGYAEANFVAKPTVGNSVPYFDNLLRQAPVLIAESGKAQAYRLMRYNINGCITVGAPVNATDATNKEYVDSKVPNYRLIQDITLEEDIQQIDISTDKDGNTLKLKSVFITFFGTFTGTAGSRSLKLAYNGGSIYQMYSPVNARIGENQFHFIKSERLNIPDRNIFVSQFPQGLGLVGNGAYNAIQGLSDMHSNLRCDYAEAQTIRTINRIQYGQANATNGLMAAGSRIFIWGIDDDE